MEKSNQLFVKLHVSRMYEELPVDVPITDSGNIKKMLL